MSKLSEKTAASDPIQSERNPHNFPAKQFSAERLSVDHLSPEQRQFLLTIAHEAIAAKISGKVLAGTAAWKPTSPSVSSPGIGSSGFSSSNLSSQQMAALDQPRGVFTTLYLRGELRGCVGYAAAVRPLVQAVAETACSAAFEDSRFPPVSRDEAPQLKIALSVLSPLFPIDAAQVQVGRHGLVISEAPLSVMSSSGTPRRGLLLPQVPVEHGWDREIFLEQTCRKAGLPLDAWKSKSVVIEAFTAEVFGDDKPGDDKPGDDKLGDNKLSGDDEPAE